MSQQKEEAPRFLLIVIRVWGAFSGLCCAAFGFFMLFTFTARCFVLGIYMVSLGGVVLLLEAPVFCKYLPGFVKASEVMERRLKFWMRGALYCVLALIPIVLCFKLSSFLGCGAVLVTAGLYGVLAVGKKGGETTAKEDDIEMKATLVDNKGNPNTETQEG